MPVDPKDPEASHRNIEAMFISNGTVNGPYAKYLPGMLIAMAKLGLLEMPADKIHYVGTSRDKVYKDILNGDMNSVNEFIKKNPDTAVAIIVKSIPNAKRLLASQGIKLAEDYKVKTSVGDAFSRRTPFAGEKFNETFKQFNSANSGEYTKYEKASSILHLPKEVANAYINYLESKGLIEKSNAPKFGLMTVNYLVNIFSDVKAKRGQQIKESKINEAKKIEHIGRLARKGNQEAIDYLINPMKGTGWDK
jgi:hypothetical protein